MQTAKNGGGNMINGYEFVDLGLSVKWATCNIGATKPEEAGLYFQYGDTQGWTLEQIANGEKVFDWESYKWCNGSSSVITKYNSSDKKYILEPEDDAAHVLIGGGARIPSFNEYYELSQLDSEYIENYNGTGRSAFKFYSKLNKQKYILFQNYGQVEKNSITYSPKGTSTAGWTSSIDSMQYASYMYIREGEGVSSGESIDRIFGLTIRPILQKN